MKKSLISGLAVAVALAFSPAAFAQSSQGGPGVSNMVEVAQADATKKKKSSKKGTSSKKSKKKAT